MEEQASVTDFDGGENHYLLFMRQAIRFCLHNSCVEGVDTNPVVTPLPGAERPFVGIASAKGRLVPCLDLAKNGKTESPAFLIRARVSELEFGIIADSVLDILPLHPARAPGKSASWILRPCHLGGEWLSDFEDRIFRDVDREALFMALRTGAG